MTDKSKICDAPDQDMPHSPPQRSEEAEFTIILPAKVEKSFRAELQELGLHHCKPLYTRQTEAGTVVLYSFAQDELSKTQRETLRALEHKYDMKQFIPVPQMPAPQARREDFTCLFPQDSKGRVEFEASILELFNRVSPRRLEAIKQIAQIKMFPVTVGDAHPQILYHFSIPVASPGDGEKDDTRFSKVRDLTNYYGGQFFPEGNDRSASTRISPYFSVPERNLPAHAALLQSTVKENFRITVTGAENIVNFEEAVVKLFPLEEEAVQLFPPIPLSRAIQKVCKVRHYGDSACYTFHFTIAVTPENTPAHAQRILHEQQTAKIVNIAREFGGIYTSESPAQSIQ